MTLMLTLFLSKCPSSDSEGGRNRTLNLKELNGNHPLFILLHTHVFATVGRPNVLCEKSLWYISKDINTKIRTLTVDRGKVCVFSVMYTVWIQADLEIESSVWRSNYHILAADVKWRRNTATIEEIWVDKPEKDHIHIFNIKSEFVETRCPFNWTFQVLWLTDYRQCCW